MWRIEYDPDSRLLSLCLTEHVTPSDMRDLARAHARALEATGLEPFRVLVDLRGLTLLDGTAADVLADMKRVAASLEGYLGRAVLVDGPTVAMQQRNTTLEDGGDDRELVTLNPMEAQRFVDDLFAPWTDGPDEPASPQGSEPSPSSRGSGGWGAGRS